MVAFFNSFYVVAEGSRKHSKPFECFLTIVRDWLQLKAEVDRFEDKIMIFKSKMCVNTFYKGLSKHNLQQASAYVINMQSTRKGLA